MTRRITCYVVFVTLLWGALARDDEKARDILNSNITRADFSNLLQSLIKLNEHRVSVLQKLYRLEDYGVLSEVLRTGDKKTGDGKLNNLFLIVMSKNQNDTSRKKVGFEVVDSVTSLDAENNNIRPKLDFVLDPAGYITQDIRKENRLESMFGNFPRVYGPTKIHRANDRSKKMTTTTKTLKYNNIGLKIEVKSDSNVLRKAKTSLKANEDRKNRKENSRYEIVSNKGRRPIASEKLLDDDGKSNKYPQTVGYNSNEYVETDSTLENDKVTTKPIIIKHILSSNHTNSKYPIDDKGELDEDDSPFSNIENDRNRQYTKMDSDISIKKLHGNNNHNPTRNKNTPKLKVPSDQRNDKLTTKPIIINYIFGNNKNSKYPLKGKDEQDEDYYGSPFSDIKNYHNSHDAKMDSDISIKKLHGNNNHNPTRNKNTPKLKVPSDQRNDKLTTKPIIINYIFGNHKNSKYPLEGKDKQDEDYYGSPFSNIENDHNSRDTKIDSDIFIKKLHGNNHHNPTTNKNTPKVKVPRDQQNDKLTTNPIKIKDISGNHKYSKYPIEGKYEQDEDYYGSAFSNIENDHNSQYTNLNSDVSIKKLHDVNNNQNPLSKKISPKVKVQSNQPPKLNQYKFILNNQSIKYTTRKHDYRINGNKASENKHSIKNSNLNKDNTNAYNHDRKFTKIKHIDAAKEINNNHKFLTLASENVYSSKPVIPETTKDTQYGSYPGFEDHKDVRDNSNKDKPTTSEDSPYGNYPGLEHHKDVMNNLNKDNPKTGVDVQYGSYPGLEHLRDVRDNYNKDNPKTVKHTPFGKYPGFEHHKVVRDNSNKDKLKTAKDTQFGNYPAFEHNKDVMDNLNKDNPKTGIDTQYGSYLGLEHHKDVRDNSNKGKPKTAKDTPFGNYPDFEHYKDVKDNSNKDKPNTAKELRFGDNLNAESKKDTDYNGVKMFDNGKRSGEKFSVFVTNVGNGTAQEVKQQYDPKLILNAFHQPESKAVARKPFEKCLNKKASKLCSKSCISAYKNVCRRLKCTSRSKKALKKECKRSCKKTFASSSSKYSGESSGDEYSDESYSDD